MNEHVRFHRFSSFFVSGGINFGRVTGYMRWATSAAGPVDEPTPVKGNPGEHLRDFPQPHGHILVEGLSSDVLPGVGRDAEYIAKHIASRAPNGPRSAQVPAETRRPEAPDRART